MISLEVYKLVHIIGIVLLFFGFGGVLIFALSKSALPQVVRKTSAIFHGIGLFLILLGGFGMLARLGLAKEWPMWVILKLVIWLVLGGAMAVAIRKQNQAMLLSIGVLVLATCAAYLGLFKV